jgi:hypothetical protein
VWGFEPTPKNPTNKNVREALSYGREVRNHFPERIRIIEQFSKAFIKSRTVKAVQEVNNEPY